MRLYPDRNTAEAILREAEPHNPGPWGNHCRIAAQCARSIALAAGLDGEKAYVLALLHDIGRRFGTGHLAHVYDGYRYMMELGYPAVAKVCLTHSFSVPRLDSYIGRMDIPAEDQCFLESLLHETTFDVYDRLIQLCDSLAGSEGVVRMEDRMADVAARYGAYPRKKWDANLKLKQEFDALTGRDIYEIVAPDLL